MSGFDFPIRRIGEGRKSGLKEKRQADLALKSNEMGVLALGKSVEKGGVPRRTLELIRQRASRINGCSLS
jgi:hypothetical protein